MVRWGLHESEHLTDPQLKWDLRKSTPQNSPDPCCLWDADWRPKQEMVYSNQKRSTRGEAPHTGTSAVHLHVSRCVCQCIPLCRISIPCLCCCLKRLSVLAGIRKLAGADNTTYTTTLLLLNYTHLNVNCVSYKCSPPSGRTVRLLPFWVTASTATGQWYQNIHLLKRSLIQCLWKCCHLMHFVMCDAIWMNHCVFEYPEVCFLMFYCRCCWQLKSHVSSGTKIVLIR